MNSAELRARLSHPVIDADAHIVEYDAILPDFIGQVAGAGAAARYVAWYERRRSTRPAVRGPWWAYLSGKHTADRAASMLPRLYAEKLDDSGIDVCVAYSSVGLFGVHFPDDTLRAPLCRAINAMNAEMFGEVSDRILPAAVIPMDTPREALAELEYAVNELGLRSIMISSFVYKPVPEVLERAPDVAAKTTRMYSLGLNSAHDYDPFWKRCTELKVAVAGHSKIPAQNFTHSSPDNFMFNHLNVFAAGAEYMCRSLFLGGVTRRFPKLHFAFLEGGVHWASALYNGIVEHWEKRNPAALREYFDPDTLDIELLAKLFAEYGNERLTAELVRRRPHINVAEPHDHPDELNEWAACGIARKEDIRDLFVPRFFFGCEPDDRLIALAFDRRLHHMGVKLQAVFGSDLGHWDVLDPRKVLSEAWELVEHGLITEEDFRDFVCTNPAKLYAGMNPDFFEGTRVADRISGTA
jgi:predicted TIM-barrel fold metal-dependent hydrolase